MMIVMTIVMMIIARALGPLRGVPQVAFLSFLQTKKGKRPTARTRLIQVVKIWQGG